MSNRAHYAREHNYGADSRIEQSRTESNRALSGVAMLTEFRMKISSVAASTGTRLRTDPRQGMDLVQISVGAR